MTNAYDSLDAQLDRLVDGELDSAEYRSLLLLLDERSDGWRRCALAFLEAQALRAELSGLTASRPNRQPRPQKPVSRSSRDRIGLVLSLVASFVLALLLGITSRMLLRDNRVEPDRASAPATDVSREIGDASPPAIAITEQTESEGEPLGSMTLELDRPDGSTELVDLPVYGFNRETAGRLVQESPSLAPHVRRTLEGLGYEVHRDVRWVPIEVERNRRVLVPTGQIEITPVSDRAFH